MIHYYFDYFMFLFFLFHVFLLYFYYFRVLKFLLSLEITLVIILFFVSLKSSLNEISFYLLFISVIVCESAIGLVLLIGLIRRSDKNNVKGGVYNSF